MVDFRRLGHILYENFVKELNCKVFSNIDVVYRKHCTADMVGYNGCTVFLGNGMTNNGCVYT